MNLRKIFKNAERRPFFLLSGLILWLCLDASYRIFVSPVFAYSGYLLTPEPLKYLEAILIYTTILLVFPRLLVKPSDYLMSILAFGFLAPFLVFYALADQSRSALYIVLMCSACIEIFRHGRPINIPFIKSGYGLGVGLLFMGALLITVWLLASGGLRYFNLDLSAVYDFRRDAGEVANVGVMGYLNNWGFKVFGPSLLAIALWKKYRWLAIVVLILHVIWFGISSHKSVLFYPVLVLFLWALLSRTSALSLVAIGMSIAVAGSLIYLVLTDDIFIPSMFIRRTFFVISNNTFYYYEFFSVRPFVYWSNSITSAFIDYPYHINPARLVGESRGSNSHINNSFLATGYMHAGVAGVMFYGVLVGLLFRLIDSVARRGIPTWVAVSILIVPSWALLLNADLPTALLTHGVGVAVLVLILIRSKPKCSENTA